VVPLFCAVHNLTLLTLRSTATTLPRVADERNRRAGSGTPSGRGVGASIVSNRRAIKETEPALLCQLAKRPEYDQRRFLVHEILPLQAFKAFGSGGRWRGTGTSSRSPDRIARSKSRAYPTLADELDTRFSFNR
jgi:hypothetical protein